MVRIKKEELLFVPLGGCNEIGMNVNLYHYKGKWIMIDLGAGFAQDDVCGVQMLAPDLSFIEQIKKDLIAIIFTHAHEDHVGSIGHLYELCECPIYATKFTAGLIRHKLGEAGKMDIAEIIEVNSNENFNVGPFELEMVQITHSIPEMNAVFINTEYGYIAHTGDWKFDDNPVEGGETNYTKLEDLGKKGVLAMMCDSTNVFNDRHSGSEGNLEENIYQVVKETKDHQVIVTTFASNVARFHTLAKVAQRTGRKLALAGWSMRRISMIAKEAGYLTEFDNFISEKEIKNYKRGELLIMCTGCQGEEFAAMNKIANNEHQNIKLSKKDTVIFSSKIIPGNERRILNLLNKFAILGCEVITEKDHKVHVSGHPSRQELTKMYEMVKPEIAIPVHGEPVHIAEHVHLTENLGIKHSLTTRNGDIWRLAPNNPVNLGKVKSGYLAIDGRMIVDKESEHLKTRKKLQNDGIVIITIILSFANKLIMEPAISYIGVIPDNAFKEMKQEIHSELIEIINANKGKKTDKLMNSCRKFIKNKIQRTTGKMPLIEFQLGRM